MAAPFITGVVAQYIAINGAAQDVEIRSRLMSHSKPVLESNDATSPLASVGRLGAGLVQAYDAIFATATASPAQLALNDSTYFKSEQVITIKNLGNAEEKYSTVHLPSGTAETGNTAIAGYTAFNSFPLPLTTEYAGVVFTPSEFTLAPGASKDVKVIFTPPRINQEKFPVYSGYIKFVGSTPFSTLSVPYLGLAAAIAKRPVLDSTSQYFKDLPMPGFVSSGGSDFPPGEPVVDLSASSPLLIFRLTFGSPLIDISIVPVNTTFDATIKHSSLAARSRASSEERMTLRYVKRDSEHRLPLVEHAPAAAASNPALFNDVATTGSVLRSLCEFSCIALACRPAAYADTTRCSFSTVLTRNTEDAGSYYIIPISNKVTKADGSASDVMEGRYRVLLRAQRMFADATLTDSYESYLTDPFTYRKST